MRAVFADSWRLIVAFILILAPFDLLLFTNHPLLATLYYVVVMLAFLADRCLFHFRHIEALERLLKRWF